MSYEVIVNDGAGRDETRGPAFDSKRATETYILSTYGAGRSALETVGHDDDHGDLRGLFLCPEGCADHADDGHPFVFMLASP